jgi:hypothetical protein
VCLEISPHSAEPADFLPAVRHQFPGLPIDRARYASFASPGSQFEGPPHHLCSAQTSHCVPMMLVSSLLSSRLVTGSLKVGMQTTSPCLKSLRVSPRLQSPQHVGLSLVAHGSGRGTLIRIATSVCAHHEASQTLLSAESRVAWQAVQAGCRAPSAAGVMTDQ